MTLGRATSEDTAAIEALLLQHVQTSMFPLANLRNHGIDGPASRSLRVWMTEDADRLVAVTNEGMVMPQAPRADGAFWENLRALLDLPLIGAVGAAGQVRAMLSALGLNAAPTRLDVDEAGFSLQLDALKVPNRGRAHLFTPTQAEADLLTRWRSAYHTEVLGTPAGIVLAEAAKDIAGYLARDSHRLLVLDGEPVSMTGFNATVGQVVQIGGVYTPPALRGRGHARLALALHLEEARQAGMTRAVLFTGSTAAASAYRAVGFQPAESIALVLFDTPQRVCA